MKTRIGIDDRDSYDELLAFVDTVAGAGCETFIVHARKAWLNGISPKQNREIPPLQYEAVHQLKAAFPDRQFIINGGFKTLQQASEQLAFVDGVMMGREVYHNPYILAEVDKVFFQDDHALPSRHEVLQQLLPYVEEELYKGTRLHSITRHILGLFQGLPGARAWRRHLSENATRPGAGLQVLMDAADRVSAE